MRQVIANSKFGRVESVTVFANIVKLVFFTSLMLLFLLLVFQLLEKSNLLIGKKINMDVFDVLHYWVAYGAFYAIIFLSLPALSTLLLLRYILKQKGVLVNIRIHLRLALFNVMLVVIIIFMIAFN
jgi:hypothetical protein